MRLDTLVAQQGSTLRAELRMVVIKCKNVMFFNFWALCLKIYLFDVAPFFLLNTYPVNSIFSVEVRIYMINVF